MKPSSSTTLFPLFPPVFLRERKMLSDSKDEGLLATIMKILHTHLILVKLFSFFLFAIAFSLTFGITVSFYCESVFSLHHRLQTQENPNAIPPLKTPEYMNALNSSKDEVGIKDHIRNSSNANAMGKVMSDEELMWRASLSTTHKKNTSQEKLGVPKVAFLFLVKGPIPLAPLWEAFFKGHQGFYSIYVHSHPSFNSSSSEDGVFRGRRINSQEVRWGKFSMVEAELRLLSNALIDDLSNQRFILLSESCIPLFNFTTIYSYLINSTQTHVSSFDMPGHAGRGRYRKYLEPTVTLQQWRKGSQWFELDRDLALQLISDQAYFLVFKGACSQYPCCADEHYLSTWVNINAFGARKNSNRSLTSVDWSKGKSHPASYRKWDVTVESLERLRSRESCEYNGKETNVCYLFARKFLPDTLYRLLRFAPIVMHF